jgi:hypothetical protein
MQYCNTRLQSSRRIASLIESSISFFSPDLIASGESRSRSFLGLVV